MRRRRRSAGRARAARPATGDAKSALRLACGCRGEPASAAPRSAELDPAGREALARQAHASLKARELGRLRTLMCVETNRNCARPEPKGVLDTFGKSPASDRSELGAVLVNESARVHFAGTEWDRDRGAADCTPALPFSVGLKREAAGRTCVSGVGVTASARSR